MTDEERIQWESQKQFSSFGVACDQVYYTCIPENFTSENELHAFVNLNKDLLQIVKENDESYLEPINYRNRYRYVANQSKLFQVGNETYKIFEQIIIKVPTDRKNILEEINEENLHTTLETLPLGSVFYSQEVNPQKKITTKQCTDRDHFTDTELLQHSFNGSGKESLHVRFSLAYNQISGLSYLESVEYVVRPYKKVLGIWYWRKADLSMDVLFSVNSYDYLNRKWGTWSRSRRTSLGDSRVIEGNFTYSNPTYTSQVYYFPSYSYLSVTATNSKTSPVVAEKHF